VLQRVLPWLFLLGAVCISLVLINGTGPAACDAIPRAFEKDVRTEVGGDEIGVYSSCEVTDASGAVVDEETQVNWAGLLASLGLCAAAWSLGALVGGRLETRRGMSLLLASTLVAVVALASIFV
jgi:hypothetical protein